MTLAIVVLVGLLTGLIGCEFGRAIEMNKPCEECEAREKQLNLEIKKEKRIQFIEQVVEKKLKELNQ